jgi:HSP20 family molecular chaperone IbpA
MVEIKEPKEQKTPDVARLVDESMNRLHDMERRLHAVQGHLSGLVNMANVLHQSQPAGFGPSPVWNVPELAVPAPPSFAFAGPMTGAPFFGATTGAGPTSYGAAAPLPGRTPTPWTPFAAPTPGLTGAGLSARDFDKLPAVARVPEVNFVDAGDKYVIKIELPGVRKDDLDITVSERMITVDAEARQEIGEGTVLVGEVVPAVYRRSIALPSSCNSAKCKASLKDGFLSIEVPKKEPTEGPRRLDVAYG